MEIVATYVPSPGRQPADELRMPPDGATAVELRADLLGAETDLAALVAASSLPVILTLRSRAEGGSGPDDPAERRRFFERNVALPVAFLDVEAARDSEVLGAVVPRERVILSRHFAGLPDDLEEMTGALLAANTRFVKVVPNAGSLADALAVVRLAMAFDRGPRAQRRAVLFAAGEAGRLSRLLGPLVAAPHADAAWDEERAAAPGQLTPASLLAVAGHLHGRPRRVFGVIGTPVGRSLSPRMHGAAYRALGLPNILVPIEVTAVSELGALLRPLGESELDALGLPAGGFAVTMPWKEEAAQRCDVLAPRAQRARAANTVLPRPGKVVGDCTDIDGLTRVLLEEGVELGDARALVLGTGAAARAAVVALDLAGAEVAVCGRDGRRAEAVARELGVHAVELAASERFDAVVNATPAGGDGSSSPFLEGLRLPAGAVAVDLPYAPVPTFLEQLATSRAWRFVGGREVLLYQGVAQFAAMNAVAPPVRAMAAALGLAEESA